VKDIERTVIENYYFIYYNFYWNIDANNN